MSPPLPPESTRKSRLMFTLMTILLTTTVTTFYLLIRLSQEILATEPETLS